MKAVLEEIEVEISDGVPRVVIRKLGRGRRPRRDRMQVSAVLDRWTTDTE